MNTQRLEEIRTLVRETEQARERLHGIMGPHDRPRAPMVQAVLDLLADVDRLHAYETASRPVIDAVALSMEVEDGIFDQPFYALMSPQHQRDRQWHERLIIQARAARSGE